MTNMEYCTLHKNGDDSLDELMEILPLNQDGAARHTCPYCLFKQGKLAGVLFERNRIASNLNIDPNDLINLTKI